VAVDGTKRNGKKNCDAALVTALAAGGSAAGAATHAQCSERTVRRRLQDAAFRAQVDAARADLVSQTVGRLSALGTLATEALQVAVKSGDTKERLTAAKVILEYQYRGTTLDALL
jgi:hypothetical protein